MQKYTIGNKNQAIKYEKEYAEYIKKYVNKYAEYAEYTNKYEKKIGKQYTEMQRNTRRKKFFMQSRSPMLPPQPRHIGRGLSPERCQGGYGGCPC
jgi:hypothetical protein